MCLINNLYDFSPRPSNNLIITPGRFSVHSLAIRGIWAVFYQAAVRGLTLVQLGPFNKQNVTLDISHGHILCRDPHPANEVKREELWEEKWPLRAQQPLHASRGSFLFMLFLMTLYYFPLFLHFTIFCAIMSERMPLFLLLLLPASPPTLHSFLRDNKNAQARLFVKIASCITMTA